MTASNRSEQTTPSSPKSVTEVLVPSSLPEGMMQLSSQNFTSRIFHEITKIRITHKQVHFLLYPS